MEAVKSLLVGICLCLNLTLLAVTQQPVASNRAERRWYRGNLHTHTLNSDGDATPDEVARWYRENNYQFLVITDHNFLTNIEGLNQTLAADERFLLIKGEEVTDTHQGKPIHINAFGINRTLEPQGGDSIAATLQRNVDAIRHAAGVPLINHPNFGWAITADDLKQLRNVKLLEIYSGHPHVNVHGGINAPNVEAMWDEVLSSGKLFYGVAVDDMHDLKKPLANYAARPGQAWVAVRAAKLNETEILAALEQGDFYASTGIEITSYEASDGFLQLAFREARGSKYRVQFIGRGGRVLLETSANPARYMVRGDEGYVRAKVTDSNGHIAWMQPVMLAIKRAS